MRLIFLLGFLTIVLFNTVAQTDFRPGYIITNSMDTIHGLVDYRGEIRNMKICTFKEASEVPSKEFLPGDIYGYRYNSGKYFLSKNIKTKELNDIVFVEFLLKGISNLYYYTSSNYSAYFIESKDSGLLELKNGDIKIKKDGHVYLGTDKRYIGLLNIAFADCPEILKEISSTNLTHKALIKLTRSYHDYKCTGEACIVYEKKLTVLRIELKPMIGYSFTGIKFKNSDLEMVDFQLSSSPVVGLAMNFILPRINEKLSFLFNFAFNRDYFYGTSSEQISPNYFDNRYYHIYNTNFMSSFAFKYTYPKGKVRPEVFVGLYGNYILNSETKFYIETVSHGNVSTWENNYEIFRKFQSGFVSGIGVEYKLLNKLRAFSNFSFLYGENFQYNGIKTNSTSYRISTGLTF